MNYFSLLHLINVNIKAEGTGGKAVIIALYHHLNLRTCFILAKRLIVSLVVIFDICVLIFSNHTSADGHPCMNLKC